MPNKLVKFTGRKPPAAGMGRRKGSRNKVTGLLKTAILEAAAIVGSDGKGEGGLVGYCRFLACNEPRAFAQLLGKVLPMQVSGDDDGSVTFRIDYESERTNSVGGHAALSFSPRRGARNMNVG